MKVFTKIVAYYRVSTKKQVTSFEVQQETIDKFSKRHNAIIIAVYKEVEHGDNADRPELAKALAHAKLAHAQLVVAHMDRLARDLHFTTGLLREKVNFLICDFPEADEQFMIYSAMQAQYELRRIRQRTRDVLRFKRDNKGVLLGSSRPEHWDGLTIDGTALRSERRLVGATRANRQSAKLRTAKAVEYANSLYAIIQRLDDGLTYDEIAAALNEQGLVSPRGAQITKSLVSKVLARIA